MSTPPSPSSDEFDMLKNVTSEQRKSLKKVIKKLDKVEEMAEKRRIEKEKARIEKEKAQQRYESSVHELMKTALTVKAVLEPMKKVNNLKITDPPLPTFSNKGEKKQVGEYSGTKEANGIQNSGVDQRKRPRVRARRFSADLTRRKSEVKVMFQEKLTKLANADETDEEEDDVIAKKQKKKGSFTQDEKEVGEYYGTKDASGTYNSGVAKVDQRQKPRVRARHFSADMTPRKSAVNDMIKEELSKLADAYETDEDEDEDDAIAKKQKKMGSSTQGEEEVGEYSGTKEASGTQNSGVAQRKKRGVRGTYMLSRRCDLKIIDNITENLESKSLEEFKTSCFGRLLEIKKLRCQGQLLLHLLLNVDKDASNKEKKLIFKMNNGNIEFGPTEFSHITGLRIGKCDGTITPSLSSSSSIHYQVFNGRNVILLKDVKEAFLHHNGKGELTLKLALLYFLYGTLLARNTNKMIDLRYMDLIEDQHKFNEFPWGQVAYEFLVSSVLSTRAIMDDSAKLKERNFFVLCGFSVALQVWAYESIPALAKHCAVRLYISKNEPLILHWSTQKKVLSFNDLRKFFTQGDDEAHLEDVKTDTNRQPEKGKLLSHKDTAKDDTIIIIDTDDDDDDDLVSRRENKRNGIDLGETRNTSADSDARSTTDSDVDSAYMDELVASCAPK